jgi:uncharacterized protein YcbK (DUF882 family)
MLQPRLSEHFTAREFDCHDGTPIPDRLIPAARRVAEWWLEPFRSRFGPTTVHSGFRTATYNASVGGASASVHLGRSTVPHAAGLEVWALAADVSGRDGHTADWARWAVEHRRRSPHLGALGRGGVGVYLVQRFVHLDTAASRDWRG